MDHFNKDFKKGFVAMQVSDQSLVHDQDLGVMPRLATALKQLPVR